MNRLSKSQQSMLERYRQAQGINDVDVYNALGSIIQGLLTKKDVDEGLVAFDAEMYSEYNEKIQRAARQHFATPKIRKGIYRCPKKNCLSDKIETAQAQTRSADEGMTTLCRCTACGHSWVAN